MNQAIYDRLIETAQAEDVTYYSEIAPLAGLDMDSEPDRDRISQLLGEISTFEYQHGRPLLSAAVIHFEDNMPGRGFFTLARQLGFSWQGRDYMFFAKELRRVHDHWKPDATQRK